MVVCICVSCCVVVLLCGCVVMLCDGDRVRGLVCLCVRFVCLCVVFDCGCACL